jgi:hypothetical protein
MNASKGNALQRSSSHLPLEDRPLTYCLETSCTCKGETVMPDGVLLISKNLKVLVVIFEQAYLLDEGRVKSEFESGDR